MGTQRYEGDDIEVTYEVKRCIHAAECTRGLPAVFDPERRPWVQLRGADADEVVRVIERCPTGALRYTRRAGMSETADAMNTVRPTANGPLYVRGAITLRDAGGSDLATETRVALCRCGAAANKPYCDGKHVEIGFSDPGALPPQAAGDTVTAAPSGPLQITVSANGPLRLDGPVVLEPGDLGTPRHATKVALCRCGASANKPYCDGSHKRIGFAG